MKKSILAIGLLALALLAGCGEESNNNPTGITINCLGMTNGKGTCPEAVELREGDSFISGDVTREYGGYVITDIKNDAPEPFSGFSHMPLNIPGCELTIWRRALELSPGQSTTIWTGWWCTTAATGPIELQLNIYNAPEPRYGTPEFETPELFYDAVTHAHLAFNCTSAL